MDVAVDHGHELVNVKWLREKLRGAGREVTFAVGELDPGFGNHPALLALSAKLGHPLTDTWCMKLAALHLKHMLETGEDMEKTLVTTQPAEIERYARELADSLVAK